MKCLLCGKELIQWFCPQIIKIAPGMYVTHFSMSYDIKNEAGWISWRQPSFSMKWVSETKSIDVHIEGSDYLLLNISNVTFDSLSKHIIELQDRLKDLAAFS